MQKEEEVSSSLTVSVNYGICKGQKRIERRTDGNHRNQQRKTENEGEITTWIGTLW